MHFFLGPLRVKVLKMPLPLQILAQQQLEKQETLKSQTQSQTQRPSVSIPQPHALLQAPPPQVLVIERIYSGKSIEVQQVLDIVHLIRKSANTSYSVF